MDLIIGGAFQGKRDFAKRKYHLTDKQVFTCTTQKEPDFSAPCIAGLEEFVFFCVENGKDAVAYFKERRAAWEQSVLICDDIFCGVVPMEAENRLWREETGRLCTYLSGEAQAVYRLFCGLEQRLK